MLFPPTIEPQQLVPAGGEFDPMKVVACLCPNGHNTLGHVKLVWADIGSGPGYYAYCAWQCHLKHFTLGGRN